VISAPKSRIASFLFPPNLIFSLCHDDIPAIDFHDAIPAVNLRLCRVSAVENDRHVILSFFPPPFTPDGRGMRLINLFDTVDLANIGFRVMRSVRPFMFAKLINRILN
jgi:hypothetical protein